MRTLSVVFFIISFLLSPLKAQKDNIELLDEPKAIIDFNSTEYDFGTLSFGIIEERKIEFTNKGNLPLVLKEIKASCGCTALKWPKKPIMPGEKGEFIVHYSTSKKGHFRKSLTVLSNASNSNVKINIKGEVKALKDVVRKGEKIDLN